MKILLISQYFWPESFVINELVKALAAQGHDITVLTGKPNYPDGKVFKGYQASGTTSEDYLGQIPVFRAPLRPRSNGGAKNLVLNYLSFVWNGLVYFPGAVKGKDFDVVLVFCLSPVTSVIPAIYLKWRLKKHLAVWVQDLWPESLSATGFIRNPFVLRLVGILVKGIYACTDTLLVQSQAFYNPVARYARADKIIYYPNCYSDISGNAQARLDQNLLSTLNSNFCIVFAGNLGIAQSVQTIVEAAEMLRHLQDCKLVLVGSGSMLAWLRQQKEEKHLDNLVLPGRFPPSQMPHIFSRAAGLLVTLKRDQIFAYTVPSKVQAYLAAGKPIIAALDGEGARVVEEANAGLSCPAEDGRGLAQAIIALYKMLPEERERFGQSGRQYFLDHFEMERQAHNLVEILASRIGRGAGGRS